MHSVSDDGNVYSWGTDREKSGILGLGTIYIQHSPILNPNFNNRKIIEISLSEKHAAAMDSNSYI
jgi:alpha-tubulin suppressor-like RCC1 family protein